MASVTATPDPLALIPDWPSPVPLIPLETALEQSVFSSGLSRQDWLRRLAQALHRPALVPLLWLLPRHWRLSPALLPARLQALAAILEQGLLTPALLAALVDDLPQLLPQPGADAPTALQLWSRQQGLPSNLAALLQSAEIDAGTDPQAEAVPEPAPEPGSALCGGLIWRNIGLQHGQSAGERRRNGLAAQVLNRLGANLLEQDRWSLDGQSCGSDWLQSLQHQGWSLRGQLRTSVASFGLGASLPAADNQGWLQVPLALPMRTGLLDAAGQDIRSLLPHSCLELELQWQQTVLRLQFYQGTEGLCGWEGLNDLQRPWQNDRDNGTVRYLGQPLEGGALLEAVDLCELMALIHNQEGSERHLFHGGYGSLGFCIDTSALLQQALEGSTQLFPILLGGVWRERLRRRGLQLRRSAAWDERHRRALERYLQALDNLPLDIGLHGAQAELARHRLLACQPLNSPFRLVQELPDQVLASTCNT